MPEDRIHGGLLHACYPLCGLVKRNGLGSHFMETIPVVSQKEFDLARKMEEKMLSLPEGSGVLFVGVSVVVTLHQNPIYFIGTADSETHTRREVTYRMGLGMDRSFDLRTAEPLVRMVLADIAKGCNVVVDAFRGCVRKTA